MLLGIQGAMLDLCVLSIIDRGDTYGYMLTQSMRDIFGVSESTIYPVMRRLQSQNCLTTYDVPHDGRNRRYYSLTENGRTLLRELRDDWREIKLSMDSIIREDGK